MPLQLRCGRCIGCRRDKLYSWSLRSMHEAQMHDQNCFLTLTYSDANLPEDRSLKIEHWQKFAKRLRKKHGPFRYLHCGEYGGQTLRPHYHALIFGLDFSEDSIQQPGQRRGHEFRISASLTKLWKYGHHTIGPVNNTTARYVASYTIKKAMGLTKDTANDRVDSSTGECWSVKPEYATMSRNPGLGASWFEKYHSDVYPSNFVISDGKKATPPIFYDNLLKKQNPQLHKKMIHLRKSHIKNNAWNHTQERLDVREEVTTARTRSQLTGALNAHT